MTYPRAVHQRRPSPSKISGLTLRQPGLLANSCGICSGMAALIPTVRFSTYTGYQLTPYPLTKKCGHRSVTLRRLSECHERNPK